MKKRNGFKRIMAGLFMGGVLLSASACQAEKAKDTLTVGIIQLGDNGAFTDMREGFINQLRAQGYTEDKLTIDFKNAQGDFTALNSICTDMVNAKVDLIAAIATPPAQAIVNMGSDIPVIFISLSDPITAGVISDMNKPDKNATGTSNAIPVDEIFKFAETLTPGIQTYGFIYNTGEVNSMTTINAAKAYLDTVGVKYVDSIVTNSSEVQQAAQALVGKVEGIFVPNDQMIQSAMPLAAEVARDAKIPLYGSSNVMVQTGAFATIATTDREIGRISADMAIQYFKGTAIADIPAVVVPATDTIINAKTAEILGIGFSDDVKAKATFIEDVQK